jgi:hypothetical protein
MADAYFTYSNINSFNIKRHERLDTISKTILHHNY